MREVYGCHPTVLRRACDHQVAGPRAAAREPLHGKLAREYRPLKGEPPELFNGYGRAILDRGPLGGIEIVRVLGVAGHTIVPVV